MVVNASLANVNVLFDSQKKTRERVKGGWGSEGKDGGGEEIEKKRGEGVTGHGVGSSHIEDFKRKIKEMGE